MENLLISIDQLWVQTCVQKSYSLKESQLLYKCGTLLDKSDTRVWAMPIIGGLIVVPLFTILPILKALTDLSNGKKLF